MRHRLYIRKNALIISICLLGLAGFRSASAATVFSLTLTDAPIRVAIQELWKAGGPAGTSYRVEDDVSEKTRIDSNFINVTFETALSQLCRGADITYRVDRNEYIFSSRTGSVSRIVITPRGDRLNWSLVNADPVDASRQLAKAFSKKIDDDITEDPTPELQDLAESYLEQISTIQQLAAPDQPRRLNELKEEAQFYIKPPKARPSNGRKSVTVEENNVSFAEAMNTLGEAGGFLWFRAKDGILLRDTISQARAKSIFESAGVWSALQK